MGYGFFTRMLPVSSAAAGKRLQPLRHKNVVRELDAHHSPNRAVRISSKPIYRITINSSSYRQEVAFAGYLTIFMAFALPSINVRSKYTPDGSDDRSTLLPIDS